MEQFTTTVALIGIVIVVASLLSGALERSGLPVVVVFLALGAVLGPAGLGLVDIGFGSPSLRPLATLGLALVLFSDAVTIDLDQVRARRPLLWRLLGPGTLAPAAIVGLAAWLLLDVPAPAAAILGAALASTDPVLLRGVLHSRALPPTPRVALRIETGMNDAVLLPIVVLSTLLLGGGGGGGGGGGVGGRELARSVVGLFLLGPLLGAMVGWLGITALVRVRARVGVRRDYESLYAIGLAFSGYAAAEGVGGSGFLAAFAAGLLVVAQDVELCDCFLEYGEATAEMLLLLTFVALGTSLIWAGLTVIDWRTLLFAAVALVARTAVLHPMLARAGLDAPDRRLIALFGPRGLSSLLLVLLPVFAGIPGAERLFDIACLVVLLSILLHGVGIAMFLRAHARAEAPLHPDAAGVAPPRLATVMDGEDAAGAPSAPELPQLPERVTVEELREMRARGEPVIVVDARTDRAYAADTIRAAGAVRVSPRDPVRDATALRLSRHATLVVYCA